MLSDKQIESRLEAEALTAEWLEEASPAEIDAAWAKAVGPAQAIFEQAAARHTTAEKYGRFGGYAEQAKRYAEESKALFEKAREMRREVEQPFLAEWDRRGGWTRAYVVPGGHIHKETYCRTLYPTTLISWLPEQSGLSEEEIVERAGMMACTVCYPSAPVEALRAAHEAEKRAGECPGSRSYDYDMKSHRQTSYTGTGRARCNHCGQSVGTSKIGKMRAHKVTTTEGS